MLLAPWRLGRRKKTHSRSEFDLETSTKHSRKSLNKEQLREETLRFLPHIGEKKEKQKISLKKKKVRKYSRDN